MSVLIRDMDMPKNCDSCPFLYESRGYMECKLTEQVTDFRQATTERLPDCPLVELEENRMYCLKDGVVYMSNATIPNGKTIKIPGIIEFAEGKE